MDQRASWIVSLICQGQVTMPTPPALPAAGGKQRGARSGPGRPAHPLRRFPRWEGPAQIMNPLHRQLLVRRTVLRRNKVGDVNGLPTKNSEPLSLVAHVTIMPCKLPVCGVPQKHGRRLNWGWGVSIRDISVETLPGYFRPSATARLLREFANNKKKACTREKTAKNKIVHFPQRHFPCQILRFAAKVMTWPNATIKRPAKRKRLKPCRLGEH